MVEKRFAGGRQFNAVSATVHQLDPDFLLEIPDLPTRRWLKSVELLVGGNGQTACIVASDIGQAWAPACKVYFDPTSGIDKVE
jgi:hypothetical protein